MSGLKVLLVQLGANGDCLFVTAIAKQIKETDSPGCHLVWLIGSKYKYAALNNPYIDEIIEWPVYNADDLYRERNNIDKIVSKLSSADEYKYIFITDYYVPNLKNWYGTTRSSILRCYPHKIKDITPVMCVSNEEKENVRNFCYKFGVNRNYFNILVEASPQSNQSSMSMTAALYIADQIAILHPGIKFIISSPTTIPYSRPYIIDASSISWRENAELANYCDLLLGCSSGISWLCLSNWVNSINMVQVIDPRHMNGRVSASVKHDFMYHGLSTDKIIELYNPANQKIIDCISSIYEKGFAHSRRIFDSSNYYTFVNRKFLKNAKISWMNKLKIKAVNAIYWLYAIFSRLVIKIMRIKHKLRGMYNG
jgi:hypothetical protein